jgi:hypothetical protein
MTADVLTTSDLSLFVFDRTNRRRNPKALADLRKSIRRVGFLTHLFPVVVSAQPSGSLLVLDGQHRVMIAREMNLPVCYVVAEGLTIEDAPTINVPGVSWSLDDYVRSYAERGSDHYGAVLGLMQDYGVSAYVAASALGASADGPIKSGELTLSPEQVDDAAQLLGRCNDFEGIMPHHRFHGFVKAMREVSRLSGYDHSRMMSRAERYGIEPRTSSGHYVRELLRAYNTRTPNELRITHPRYGDGS